MDAQGTQNENFGRRKSEVSASKRSKLSSRPAKAPLRGRVWRLRKIRLVRPECCAAALHLPIAAFLEISFTGLSRGRERSHKSWTALSTPSRNLSQPPEGDPEQIMLDDHGDSLSDSPISAKTPDIDNDSLGDVEMLPGYGNCSMDSQMLQEPNPVVDSTQYFPDSCTMSHPNLEHFSN